MDIFLLISNIDTTGILNAVLLFVYVTIETFFILLQRCSVGFIDTIP